MTVYILNGGIAYEGSWIVSVHRTLDGVLAAAAAYRETTEKAERAKWRGAAEEEDVPELKDEYQVAADTPWEWTEEGSLSHPGREWSCAQDDHVVFIEEKELLD
jgi:hypothetical protein